VPLIVGGGNPLNNPNPSDGSGGPLGWSVVRERRRQTWVRAEAGSGAGGSGGAPAAGSCLSGLTARAAGVRRRAGRAAFVPAVLPGTPAAPAPPPLRAAIVARRRSTPPPGRVRMPGPPPQSARSPLASTAPVMRERAWRPGLAALRGRLAIGNPVSTLKPVVAGRPGRRYRTGSVALPRFGGGTIPALLPPSRAILTPTARRGGSARPMPRAWSPPCFLQAARPILPGVTPIRRGGESTTRRRPGLVSRWVSVGMPFDGQLHYNIYGNSGSGDAIDYAAPIAGVLATSWTSASLAPGTWSFGVRAADGNGEEQNLDCAIAIVLDASGNDVTNRPGPPVGVRAIPLAGAVVRVEWYYPPTRGAGTPTGFNVYLGTGGVPDYSSPAAMVAYGAGILNTFVANLSGLSDGVNYAIGVRSFNASGEEANTRSLAVAADATGPKPVDGLNATTIV
jgi:hypothetical protein